MKKVPVHVTLPHPLAAALKAYAELEGRAVSDVLEELGRNLLREKNAIKEPTGQEILARVAQMLTENKPRKPKPKV